MNILSMSLSNVILLSLSAIVSAVSLFFALRLFEPMQDIYFGRILSNKEVFRVTATFTFLILVAIDGFAVAFIVFQNLFNVLSVSEIISFGIISLIVFPVSLIGAYWSYFLAGRYRNWLFPRLRRRNPKNLKESKDVKYSSNNKKHFD